MTSENEIGFVKKLLLKALTKIQERLIKWQDRDFYMQITSLHFRLYFKKSLAKEALNNSKQFKSAADRHGEMVICILFPESKRKKDIKKKIVEAFQKDLLLKARV